MYCKSCGKQIPDDSAFCPSCGGKVNTTPVKSFVPSPETTTASAPAGAKSSKAPIIVLALLLLVAVSAAGYFFYVCQVQSSSITDLSTQVNELNAQVSELDETVDKKQAKIDDYEPKAKGFDEIAEYGSASYNKGYALANFRADKDIVVVKKGSTASFTLTAYLSGGVTISSYVADTSIANVTYDSNSWYTSTGMTVHGYKQGATTVTFSNSAGSSKFTMLIIVV